MTILSVKNLTIEYKTSFKTVCAVNNVSFDIQKGESFVIVGRSGSGKSTVANAVMGLTNIDGGQVKQGSIVYKDKDLLSLPEKEKREIRGKSIAMVFQDPQSYLNPVIKAGKQLAEAYEIHNPNAKKDEVLFKAKEVLKKVGLDDFERIYNSYPHQLSGGQKQRILIAMAIINNPEILIADEPTTGLDAMLQKQILDLMLELKNNLGLTLIMITHNMKVAQKYSDTVAVMHNGEIVELGQTKEIFAASKSEYTKLLMSI